MRVVERPRLSSLELLSNASKKSFTFELDGFFSPFFVVDELTLDPLDLDDDELFSLCTFPLIFFSSFRGVLVLGFFFVADELTLDADDDELFAVGTFHPTVLGFFFVVDELSLDADDGELFALGTSHPIGFFCVADERLLDADDDELFTLCTFHPIVFFSSCRGALDSVLLCVADELLDDVRPDFDPFRDFES